MDEKFSRDLLDTLIENSSRVLVLGCGVGWAESAFFDVIKLLKQEQRLKKHFLKRVSAEFSLPAPGITPSGISTELIELVAHELKWPELLELAQQRIDTIFKGDKALAIGDVATRLASAYEDQWQDREFYERYR